MVLPCATLNAACATSETDVQRNHIMFEESHYHSSCKRSANQGGAVVLREGG